MYVCIVESYESTKKKSDTTERQGKVSRKRKMMSVQNIQENTTKTMLQK